MGGGLLVGLGRSIVGVLLRLVLDGVHAGLGTIRKVSCVSMKLSRAV